MESSQRRSSEQVAWTGSPHWAAMLGWYIKWLGIGTACFISTIGVVIAAHVPVYTPVLMFLIGIVGPLTWGHMLRNHVQYTITTRRIREKTGWMSGNYEECPLGKIENITYNQSFFEKIIIGKIFRIQVGTLNFDTAGEHSGRSDSKFDGHDRDRDEFVWWGVKNPESVLRIVNDAMNGEWEALEPEPNHEDDSDDDDSPRF
jgi:hypothetical protein